MFGTLFLDIFGDVSACSECEFFLSGIAGDFRVSAQSPSAAFNTAVPAGTYELYYQCTFNGNPFPVYDVTPDIVTLAPGPNQQDVTVGVCF